MRSILSGAMATGMRLLAGASVRFIGHQPDISPSVYFANHTSHLDFVVVWSVLPAQVRARTRPVAARDYWEAGPIRRYFASRVFRAILMDRGGIPVSERGRQFDATLGALDGGDSLILFPEGTRGTGLEMGPFKSGLYHLSTRRPDVSLVPVHIDNLNRILPKGEVLPVPILSCVSFGGPLRALEGETKQSFLTRAREAILTLRRP